MADVQQVHNIFCISLRVNMHCAYMCDGLVACGQLMNCRFTPMQIELWTNYKAQRTL